MKWEVNNNFESSNDDMVDLILNRLPFRQAINEVYLHLKDLLVIYGSLKFIGNFSEKFVSFLHKQDIKTNIVVSLHIRSNTTNGKKQIRCLQVVLWI